MPNKIKKILTFSSCLLFLACGGSEERGIVSTTADSTASGSAYISNDGFAPEKKSVVQKSTAVSVATPSPAGDTTATVIPSTTATPADVTISKTTTVPATKPAAADDSADIKKGEVLIAKSDCLACHKVDAKLLGPSYKDVAAKYPNNASTINQLAGKIKAGGSGVWGSIPMSPHQSLSDNDAKAMVKYIMSLK